MRSSSCSALFVLLLGADVNSMHAPVAHLTQGLQDLGCKLRKLEAQQFLTKLDHNAVGDWFLQHGHLDPNASVGDHHGFQQHGHPDPKTRVYNDGFWEDVEGGSEEESEKDELTQLTPADHSYIKADYCNAAMCLFFLFLGVGVIRFFLLRCSCVFDTSTRHFSCSHEQKQPEREKEEEAHDAQMEPVPEPVQPAQERVDNEKKSFHSDSSVQKNLTPNSIFPNGHTHEHDAQRLLLGGGGRGAHTQPNSLKIEVQEGIAANDDHPAALQAPETLSSGMDVEESMAMETAGPSNDDSLASPPASPATTGSTGEATPALVGQDNKRKREATKWFDPLQENQRPYYYNTSSIAANGDPPTTSSSISPPHSPATAASTGKVTPASVGQDKKRRRSTGNDDPPADSSSDVGQKAARRSDRKIERTNFFLHDKVQDQTSYPKKGQQKRTGSVEMTSRQLDLQKIDDGGEEGGGCHSLEAVGGLAAVAAAASTNNTGDDEGCSSATAAAANVAAADEKNEEEEEEKG